MNPLLKPIASMSARSAKWPIQTVVFISVLAVTAYFSIIDLSVPNYSANLATSYYVPNNQAEMVVAANASSKWTTVRDASKYPDAERFVGTRLVFAGNPVSLIPTIPGTINASPNRLERDILLPETEFNAWLATSSEIWSEDSSEVWRMRRSFSWTLWLKTNFDRVLDLIHEAETYDLVVVGLAYVGMMYTFVSLFVSVRRMGSSFSLATGILLSSGFAFLFAYVTCMLLGIHIPLVSFSEGIPFLVITVGFDSKLSLTRLALRESRKDPRSASDDIVKQVLFGNNGGGERIFRDYAIEIIALAGASFSNVNGLWQFCFLSAWILFYDIITLTTFYTAILIIKMEMNKIERNDIIRTALEEDGVSHEVAERVADSSSRVKPSELSRDSKSSKLKFAMIVGFIALNAVHLISFPIGWSMRSWDSSSREMVATLVDRIPQSPAGTIITVVPTLVFEHSHLSVRLEDGFLSFLDLWTVTIGDPLISKCIVLVLAISIGLNSYLFNAAKTPTIKIVERVVEKKVPVIIEKHASDSDSSDITDDDGIELKVAQRPSVKPRSLDDCLAVLKGGMAKELCNEELVNLGVSGKLPLYALEKQLGDTTRAVEVRRAIVSRISDTKNLEASKLPYMHYDYDRVLGACCENVIGYIPLPVGIAGPIIVDGKPFFIPMATTEGCLVASTMRGCKAINAGGGAVTVLTQDSMSRGPCVSFTSLARAGACKIWLDSEEGWRTIKKAFDSTSRFARLQSIKTALAGTLLFIRFRTTTGDAMGMNMISKGVEYSLKYMVEHCGFEDMEVISVSGNYCTDKKPAAINWIDGRGKSVVAEAIIPGEVVKSVLKSDVDALVELNVSKNLVGSAMAGSVGGFNAQAANLVTAIFLATGQDPAQNVESSNCITLMKKVNDRDLQISVSMPSIEVGTIGGGTILEPQAAMLGLLGVRGPHPTEPGKNARQLARIVAAGVLAAELSLGAALAAGHLVRSHMIHNRSKAPTPLTAGSEMDIKRLQQGCKTCIKS